MGAIGVHHTAVKAGAWDGPANEARLKKNADASYYRKEYAWVDTNKNPQTKAAYKFPHHFVNADGSIGAASVKACQAIIASLRGARNKPDIPASDVEGVYRHAAAHLRDANVKPAPLRGKALTMDKATDVLPKHAKEIWVKAFNNAYENTCEGTQKEKDECAARIAWAAVKKVYRKGADGKWVPKAHTFSLAITKASYDKATHEMRWRAVASDTEEDSYGDNMTLELFQDFIGRIERGEAAPVQFRSAYWQGGMPYLSIAHYPDLDGEAVPGEVQAIYVDGNRLKAKGIFSDNELGRRCFRAVCEDLYAEKKSQPDKPKVRISIAFLDWKHRHKGSGYVFERKSLDDICPECVKELLQGEYGGKEFLRGQLVQLALTRVPVNGRTSVEVDKSMADEITTRREDAASIVGEDLADEIEEKAKMVGKSQVLVTKSEEKETSPTLHDEIAALLEPVMERLSKIEDALEARSEATAEPHVLDEAFAELRSVFDTVAKSEMASEEKLRLLQVPYEKLGKLLMNSMGAEEKRSDAADNSEALAQAFAKAIEPLAQKLDLLVQQQSQPASAPNVPLRRSIQPTTAMAVKARSADKPVSVRELVRRQFNLPS